MIADNHRRIKVNGSINIPADLKKVFDFVANLENDQYWRKEINNTNMTGAPGIDAIACEDSFLSKRVPSHTLTLICTVYRENRQVVYQTIPVSTFYLKTDRQVEFISANETRVLYHIQFDKDIVKHALGFSLPTFLIKMAAKAAMKKYLRKLKEVLELEN